MSRVRMKQFLSIVLLITFLLSQVNITLASKQGDGIKYSSVKSVKAKHGKNLDKLIEASVRKAVGVKNKSKVVLTVAAPSDNLEVNQNFVTVSGSTKHGNTVKVNGVAVSTDLTGAFSKIVTNLPPGTNTITIIATDKAGNSTTISRTVKTPCVSITAPADNFQSNQPIVTVTGSGPVGGTVTVNGNQVSMDALGNFTGTASLIPGSNSITITGTDTKGYSTTVTRTVVYDLAPLVLTVAAPSDNLEVNQNFVTVSGSTEYGNNVKVNEVAVSTDLTGAFSKNVTNLPPGTNTITIIAMDKAGNSTTSSRTVKTPCVSITAPADNFQSNQPIVTVTGSGPVGGTVTVNGNQVSMDALGNFTGTASLIPGSNSITITGTDTKGYSTTLTRTVIYRAPTLTVTSPIDNLQMNNNTVIVSGKTEAGTAGLTVNSIAITPDASGNFSYVYTLSRGTNSISITATGVGGLSTTVTRTVVYDLAPPVLTVAAPSDNLEVNQNFVTVSGSTEYGNTVKVNGVAVGTDLTGAFSKNVTNLPPGTNTITIIAMDKAGNSTTISRTVKTPCVSITAPADNYQSNKPTVTVTGRGPVGGTVTVNGNQVSMDTLGNFTGTANLIPGSNSITITGTDTKGYSTTLTRTVIYRAPTLTVTSPLDNLQTNNNTVIVSGKTEAGTASLTVNSTAITPDASGNFSYVCSLSEGSNSISITATGVGGLSTTVTRTAVYDITPPVLTVSAPSDNLEVNQNFVTVSGSTEYGNTVKVNGVAVSTNLTGAFSKIVTNLPLGTNTITIIATDKAGNSTTISRTVKTPCVSITAPADNFQSNQPTVTVTGRGPVGGTVTVNGDRASIDTLGNFTGTVNLIPGINSITITGTDTKGYNTTLTRTVIYRAPTLTISAPGDNLQTNFNTVTVAGRVEAGIASLTVNGSAITPDAYGNFSYAYSLSKGTNIISITANGVGGLSTTVTRTVVYVSL
jgi:C4-type Zn-finger protein